MLLCANKPPPNVKCASASFAIAVLVEPVSKRVVSTGFNGFPAGVEDTTDRLENREIKYEMVVHAEQNAIGYAARNGIDTEGCIIYCTQTPCISCAKLVVAAGIKEFHYIDEYRIDDGKRFLEYCEVPVWKIKI